MTATTIPLTELRVGAAGRIVSIDPAADPATPSGGGGLEAREIDWLRAVGLFEGARVQVLRRALFGGPLHLRSSWGAELAVDRPLARLVRVAVIDEEVAPSADPRAAASASDSAPPLDEEPARTAGRARR